MIYLRLRRLVRSSTLSGSMDVVFDPVASGRLLKIPRIIDDGIREAVATRPEHAVGGDH